MDPTLLRFGALTIGEPVTAGTNVLLAAECWLCYRRLRTGRADRRGLWALFFLAMAVATLAGAFKHGLGDGVVAGWLAAVPWTSNLGAGGAVWLAQQASLASGGVARTRSTLGRLATVQLVAFLIANLQAGPSMALLVGHTAVGLLPVMMSEARARIRAHHGGAWISGGLLLSTASGLVYVGGLSYGPWFTHVDLAHVLMGISFWLIFKGVAGPAIHPEFLADVGVARLAPARGDG